MAGAINERIAENSTVVLVGIIACLKRATLNNLLTLFYAIAQFLSVEFIQSNAAKRQRLSDNTYERSGAARLIRTALVYHK